MFKKVMRKLLFEKRIKFLYIDNEQIFKRERSIYDLSTIISFANELFDFDINIIYNRLKTSTFINKVEVFAPNQIKVFVEYNGVVETINLEKIPITSKELRNLYEIQSSLHNGNLGVDSKEIQKCNEEFALKATMEFNKKNPFTSYYLQYKILQIAMPVAFFYDNSAKKIFSKEYMHFLENYDLKELVENFFGIISLENNIFTEGLSRFGIKDFEINNVKYRNNILLNIKELAVQQLLKGQIMEDVLISDRMGTYIEFWSYEKALNNLPVNYFKNSKKYQENYDRNVLLIFNKNKLDYTHIAEYINIDNFITKSSIFLSEENVNNKINLAQKTFSILVKYLRKNLDEIEKVQITSKIGEDTNLEYVNSVAKKIDNDGNIVAILNTEPFNNFYNIGDEIIITKYNVEQWKIELDEEITETSAFVLEKYFS